ncbi:MAG: MATE family efflux transporter [Rhodospirillaceae bacterium TMED63]|nr:MAG: MATE family efflux transporter [Rhodospirillaceae bacterium TMED63]
MRREIHYKMWRLAGPIIISNISVPMLGAVDTAVMGHLPDAKYLGGVAVGALVFTFIYWGFGFLRMGTGGLTAQAFGAEDADEIRACLARAAVIGIPVALILIILQEPIAWAAFSIVEATTEVELLAEEYFYNRIWGAPATLMNFALLGWFIGVQNTKAALWHQLILNGVNIVLDLVFVIGFGWGVAGVAAATAMADVAAVAFGLWLALPILRRLGGAFVREKILEGEKIRRTVALNIDIFIRTICLVFAFAYFTAQGAAFGNVVLATNAVLLNFQTFMAHALDGFAHAAEAMGGRAIGARDRDAFREAVRVSMLWGTIVAIGFSLVYLMGGVAIVDLLTGINDVRDAAREYISWSVVMPLIAVFPFILDGVYLGATRGRTMRNAMIASLVTYLVACVFFVPAWGNHGLWASLLIFMGARGITLGLRYPALQRSVGAA